jgi:plastocyanin
LALLAFAACTSGEIPVVADETAGAMSFEPKVIKVAPGQEVTFVV